MTGSGALKWTEAQTEQEQNANSLNDSKKSKRLLYQWTNQSMGCVLTMDGQESGKNEDSQ